MNGVSDAFRGIADILEMIETNGTGKTGLYISSVTPLSQNILTSNTFCTELEVRIPLFDSEIYDTRPELSAEDVQLTEDGSLLVEFLIAASSDEQKTGEHGVTEQQSEDADGCESKTDESESTDSNPTNTGTDTSDPGSTTDGKAEVPAYRKPERLREVYEEHNTFVEMTDALDVDVTPQTVRRYMIKHDIHEPASNTGPQTAAMLLDANSEAVSESGNEQTREETESIDALTPQSGDRGDSDGVAVSADGHGGFSDEARKSDQSTESTDTVIEGEMSKRDTENASLRAEETEEKSVETASPPMEDEEDTEESGGDVAAIDIATEIEDELPDHLTLDDIKSTAQNANTLYEAQRQLDLDREEARRLLQDLNLLELVHGRVTTRDLTDRTIEDINRRLRSTVVSNTEQA